jgi:hypothetical protein
VRSYHSDNPKRQLFSSRGAQVGVRTTIWVLAEGAPGGKATRVPAAESCTLCAQKAGPPPTCHSTKVLR